jgi:hypothetical protein
VWPAVVVEVVVVVVGVLFDGDTLPPPVDFVVEVGVVGAEVVVVAFDVVCVGVVGICAVVGALAVVGVEDISVVGDVVDAFEGVLWLLPPHPARATAPSSTPRTSVLIGVSPVWNPAGDPQCRRPVHR